MLTVKGTSYTHKKLKKGTYYKYLIVAVSDGRALAVFKTVHVTTKGGKNGNAKGVKVNKTSVKLKVGKTFKIKGKSIPQKTSLKNHDYLWYNQA